MVKRESVNCIAVEWKKGVKTRYAQAANNIRVVAAQVAAMLTFLMVTRRTSAALPSTWRSVRRTEASGIRGPRPDYAARNE